MGRPVGLRDDVEDPRVGVVRDDGGGGALAWGGVARQRCDGGAHLLVGGGLAPVVGQQGRVVLLLPGAGHAPPEHQQRVDPLAGGVGDPLPHLPRRHSGVVARPVDRPGLLLDDPGASTACLDALALLECGAAGEVQVERDLLGAGQAVGVAVDGADLVGPVDRAGVDVEVAHVEVGEGRHAGRPLGEHVALDRQALAHLPAGEPSVGELQAGVVHRHGGCGQLDGVEVGVGHRPEGLAPGVVEAVDVAVPIGEPRAERVLACPAPAAGGVVVARFVVDLPGVQGRVVAVAVGQHAGHPCGLLPVGRRRGAGVAAAPPGAGAAVGADDADVRTFAHQPHGRCGRRRADHHPHAGVGDGLHRTIHPAEVPAVPLGFHAGPGELADADDLQAQVGHARDVVSPVRLWPLLGVPADPDPHAVTAPSGSPASRSASWSSGSGRQVGAGVGSLVRSRWRVSSRPRGSSRSRGSLETASPSRVSR